MRAQEHLWAIVLAAGDGRRVSAWTADAQGATVPKQYCSFGEQKAMIHWALERARGVVPPEHVVVVVAEGHRRFWANELADLSPQNIVVQPQNRGTAAGILLPLLSIYLHRDMEARVLVLPSDHYVADENTLRTALVRAAHMPGGEEERVVILGMTPREFDPEYGWVLADPSPVAARVSGFVEKPDRETAAELMNLGALLSTFMFVTEARTLVRVYDQTLPGLLFSFLERSSGDHEALEQLYATITNADFSRDVLERSTSALFLLRVPDCGWSDLGTPARIQSFLNRQPPDRLHSSSLTPPAWAADSSGSRRSARRAATSASST
jgi:mannose-1-phosphate guanylyltransferase